MYFRNYDILYFSSWPLPIKHNLWNPSYCTNGLTTSQKRLTEIFTADERWLGLSQTGGLWGLKPPPPPQFLADQLTLSQPWGHILPTQYYEPPGFSDLATALCMYGFSDPILKHWSDPRWYVLKYSKVTSSNVSFRSTCRLFQIAYEVDFQSLWQKVDFLISNAC